MNAISGIIIQAITGIAITVQHAKRAAPVSTIASANNTKRHARASTSRKPSFIFSPDQIKESTTLTIVNADILFIVANCE